MLCLCTLNVYKYTCKLILLQTYKCIHTQIKSTYVNVQVRKKQNFKIYT